MQIPAGIELVEPDYGKWDAEKKSIINNIVLTTERFALYEISVPYHFRFCDLACTRNHCDTRFKIDFYHSMVNGLNKFLVHKPIQWAGHT